MKMTTQQILGLVLIGLGLTLGAGAAHGQTNGYTITPSAGPHGSIDPDQPFDAGYGSSVQFTAQADTGYAVDTWIVDESLVQTGGDTYTLTYVYTNHNVHVTFLQVGHIVTPSAGANGCIYPDEPVVVEDGGSQSFSAEPDEGYEVDTWYVDSSAVQTGDTSYLLSNVQEDQSVCVTFKAAAFTITPTAQWFGTISPSSPVVVEFGGSQTFLARTEQGYTVDTWFVDGDVAQTGGHLFTLNDIRDNHRVYVTFRPLLSYSLGLIDFNSVSDFLTRVLTNNVEGPNEPGRRRIHVERLAGVAPDLSGFMILHSLKDEDPNSPTYGDMIPARVKGMFAGTPADRVRVCFKYLFSNAQPGVMLKVSLSNMPQLMDPSNPLYRRHHLHVADLIPPPEGRPGSPGSRRAAVFDKVVDTHFLNIALNLTEGLWVELELIEPAVSKSVAIDDWNAAVQCYGICLDLNWDNFVDTADFLKVIGECGRPAEGEQACCEGVFSSDGTVDSEDVGSWDWALNSDNGMLNLCSIPLADSGTTTMMAFAQTAAAASGVRTTGGYNVNHASTPSSFSLPGLWILGKRASQKASTKLADRLYSFDAQGQFQAWSEPISNRNNTRIVQDRDGALYLLNTSAGLLALDRPEQAIIPPGSFYLDDANEPRYHCPATVTVGLQMHGSDVYGRPLLDVALDDEYAYVVPVVVNPAGEEPYLAAAKLQLRTDDAIPYRVVRIYDDPPPANDNQYGDALREVELDGQGNLYVLNAHRLNESDICRRYRPDGTLDRLHLGQTNTENYCPAPTAMLAASDGMLYLTSGLLNEIDSYTSIIKGFTTQEESLTLRRTIAIHDMQHIVSISEDVQTGNLLVVGFNMDDIPAYPNPFQIPFYFPSLALVAPGQDSARGQDLIDPAYHDLGLPMSGVMKQ